MADKPKFKVGDLVDFCGNTGKVVKVEEHHYFYGGDAAYFLYDVEYVRGGSITQVSESALHLISTAEPEIVKPKRRCECGAWATGSNADEHSRWCPEALYTPLKEKK